MGLMGLFRKKIKLPKSQNQHWLDSDGMWRWFEPVYREPRQIREAIDLRMLALKTESDVLKVLRKERPNDH